jgi:hypothetical protein
MALTSLAVQNAKPKEKPYKLSDGDDLYLLVQPSGSKLWRFRYQFAGKENMLALGSPRCCVIGASVTANSGRVVRFRFKE